MSLHEHLSSAGLTRMGNTINKVRDDVGPVVGQFEQEAKPEKITKLFWRDLGKG